MLPGVDAAVLRNLYPSALFGEGCLTSLYVPVVSCLGKSKEQQDAAIAPPSKVSMLALSDSAIHELLLVYAVRGRHALTHASDSNQQLTSLALSDAVNTLIPCRKSGSNQPAGARFCVIKNPRGFWKQSNITGNQEDLLLDFRDADFVFIECAISST
ncbi:hypothetical protein GN244_ATG01308 [Phytophthora infestans]|uniref:Uncharacterized protein n=1 Tax=Phytophthora infestans TaxID=4787 RepID=A0A833TGC8_PHYIN|nr:hypothetical protein GN244_ATG01308 [Phytophthora infestans]KAF4139111.1 hypothetical protein GN958_ATG11696 [Phytophthora infestans]